MYTSSQCSYCSHIKLDFDMLLQPVALKPKICLTEELSKIVSEYDQEIPQSQTADNPMAPQERAAQPS